MAMGRDEGPVTQSEPANGGKAPGLVATTTSSPQDCGGEGGE
jgi:hypothetical protein